MGVEKVVTVICDFPGCKYGNKGPSVIQWNETKVSTGEIDSPDALQYLVFSSHNGQAKTFCCQVCAASYFLPPGWSIVQDKVQVLPKPLPEQDPDVTCKCGHPFDIHNHYGCMYVMSNAPGDFCKCEEQGPDLT